ncbi:MAG: hypothetical protein Greene041662_352 [Candidatus Peregrinibacteria bacterium Greene0416_62]|nr:MAG: hypothetical protein Greene041662_352 [Candidatus Peregrinibacteria bacterium Greene0416_62]TSC97631.1 MAG: hypothetical protein Greene101449_1136 [Candidatus Peregrinibacteria bacterium Greene1014_49]
MLYTMLRRTLSIAAIAAAVLPAFPVHARTVDRVNAAYFRQPLYQRISRRNIRATLRKPVRSRRVSSSAPASSSSSAASIKDPDTDVSLAGRIALLGGISPVLGSAKAFNNAEPLHITTITVTLDSAVTSVDQLLIYDEDAELLGSARLDASVSGGRIYTLSVKTKNIIIPQREDYSFYVRSQLKSRDGGGTSAELLKIASIAIEGNGGWSNRTYTQSLTGTFNTHQIARSMITSITNAGAVSEPLLSGTDREIGRFRFMGVRNDGSADLRLSQLTFTLSQVGGVSLSDVQIIVDGSSDRANCTVSSSTITCPLTASFGSLTSSSRTLTLLADITIPSSAPRASLQISLNETGTPTSAGSVQWTDGTTTFDWVGFEEPVARGTYYAY